MNLFEECKKITAVYCKTKNLPVSDEMQKLLDEMPELEKLEKEIELINVEYVVKEIESNG